MHRFLMVFIFLLLLSTPAWAQKDFSLNISPPSQTINAGRQAMFTVTAQPVNGFKKPVALNLQVNPISSDVTVSLASTVINPGSSTTLIVNTSALANAQGVSITITGTAKNKVRSAQASVTVNVPQFNLTVDPPSAVVLQGDKIGFNIKSQGDTDFARPISLNVNTTPVVGFQLSKNVLSPPNDSATVTFDTAALAPGGYVVNIAGNANGIQRSVATAFTVIPKPASGNANVVVLQPSVNMRADNLGHLLITGLVQNTGTADAAFVNISARAFDKNNNLVETVNSFVNGFPGLTSTNVFTSTTLPQGKKASFQLIFNFAFFSSVSRVDFAITFTQDKIAAPKANLVIDSLTRTISVQKGSNFSVVVRNTGTVSARAPQVIIDSFDRANQIFDVTVAGVGDANDLLAPGQTRTFTASNLFPFDQTRVNDQHAIWVDATGNSIVIAESTEGLTGFELQKKQNEIVRKQRLAHRLLLQQQKEGARQ